MIQQAIEAARQGRGGMEFDVGARLKALRRERGWSQRELAKRAGVTNGMISLIEQNRVSPSISSLHRILEALPVTMADFFTSGLPAGRQRFYRSAEMPNVGSPQVLLHLVAANQPGRQMTILHECYLPGGDTGETMLAHPGEEGGVIVKGEIELTVAGESRLLRAGEAYYFSSDLPHRFRNLGPGICEIISANTPPTF